MNRNSVLRLVGLVVLVVGLVVVGRLLGITDHLSLERLHASVDGAGIWGVLLFYFAFCVGLLLHVPGLLFVAVGMLGYGRAVGCLLSFSGAVLAVCVSFWFARGVGGKSLAQIDRPMMKRILARLDAKPIRTIVILRLLFLMFPPLNYALALSNIRFRDYFVGSAIGLAGPVIAAALFFDFVYWLVTR